MESVLASNGQQQNAAAEDPGRELDDFSNSDCQWGRYNVHYLEQDGERSSGGDKRPLRPKVSSSDAVGGSRIKRHASDAGKGCNKGAAKNRNRVGRRQSEGPNGSASVARSKLIAGSATRISEAERFGSAASGGSCLEPCLRLSIIRHESDLRKKRVAFSDAPAVVWNDPPVVVFSPPLSQMSRETSSGGSSSSSSAHHHPHRRHSYPSSNSVGSADGSDGGKEGGEEGGDEVLTPKERRRRKVVMAVVCTTFILLTASALFVLITLFNASAIDEAGTYKTLAIIRRGGVAIPTTLGLSISISQSNYYTAGLRARLIPASPTWQPIEFEERMGRVPGETERRGAA